MFTRKTGSRVLIAIVLLLGATMVTGWAQQCSLRTLNGRFGFVTQGTLLVAPQPPFASIGVVTFDGQGNFSGMYSQGAGGTTATGLKLQGTYQVDSDCTMSATLSTGGHRVGVITGEGRQQEIHLIFTDPSSVASVTYKKTPQGKCSLDTLKGTYGLSGEGTVFPAGATPILMVQSGILNFDGAGKFSGRETTNAAGVVASHVASGTYTVNPDCSASVTFNAENGSLHEEGVITGLGRFERFEGIVTNQGWLFTNTLERQ